MFDFLDSDWFNITLQIVFILLIWFDIKKYRQTKKKEYIVNIVATIGFAIWVLYPYYISYFEWSEAQKKHPFENLQAREQRHFVSMCEKIDIRALLPQGVPTKKTNRRTGTIHPRCKRGV